MSLFFFSFETLTGLPEFIGTFIAFLFGCVFGSFLNVVIHRVPRGESVVFPGSACPGCGRSIAAYDNIPVISWLVLGGKCRGCKTSISARYIGVELLTGVVFSLVTWQIGFNAFLPSALIFAFAIIPLIFIDAEHMILPDVITYPLFIFAIAARIIYPVFFSGEYFSDLRHFPMTEFAGWPPLASSLVAAAIGAAVGGGSLWLVGALWKVLRGVDAMGLGDVKMMFGVGAFLGWRLTLLAIFLGAFAGAIAGVMLIAGRKKDDMQSQLPFGIFLGIGSLVAMLFGDRLVEWYMRSFVF